MATQWLFILHFAALDIILLHSSFTKTDKTIWVINSNAGELQKSLTPSAFDAYKVLKKVAARRQ